MIVLAVALVLGSFSSAVAQEVDIEGEGDAAEVRISDEANENRIDRAVLGLLIIAVGMSILTLLFWWHTQPNRRARALAARAGPPTADELAVDEPELALTAAVAADDTPDDTSPIDDDVDTSLESPVRDRVQEGAEHG